jgi:hypothetical protein
MNSQIPKTEAGTDASQAALAAKLRDTQVPAYQVAFDPAEADQLGAFTEDALSESDALASAPDLPAASAD